MLVAVVKCECCCGAGDLATMFVLEDRVTARTNSGDDEPEGNPNNIPDVDSIVAGIVGDIAPSEWGQNVTDQILELKVGVCCNADCEKSHYLGFRVQNHIDCGN